jgi:hypothetical protein
MGCLSKFLEINTPSHFRVAQSIIDELKSLNPDAKVVVRDVAKNPPPHVGEAFVAGLLVQPEDSLMASPRRFRGIGEKRCLLGGDGCSQGPHAFLAQACMAPYLFCQVVYMAPTIPGTSLVFASHSAMPEPSSSES